MLNEKSLKVYTQKFGQRDRYRNQRDSIFSLPSLESNGQ